MGLITDPADPRVRDFVGLTDVALRRVREPAEGLFIAEGEVVIRRALAAGFPLRSLLTAQKWLGSLADVVAAHPDAEVLVADDAMLEEVTGFAVHRGALASMQRLPLPSADALVESARRVVVLEDIVNHTNVGSVFRSAAALGVDAVIISPRCADPLYRRSVKVSMGGVFSVPWARAGRWPEQLDELRGAGFTTLALSPSGEVSLRELTPPDRWALLLGTEGEGLSADAMSRCDLRLRIPMAAGVDSLNVAAAAAVACYALGG